MATIELTGSHVFFFEQLGQLLDKERIDISEEGRIYLSGVLGNPASHGESAVRQLVQALAPEFLEAQRTASLHQFTRVGDRALLLRGFWWQYVERLYSHAPGAQYYEEIGQRAYRSVGTSLYDELAGLFPELCRVLALLWSQTSVRTDKDLVTLYRFWMHTKSQYAQAILQRYGLPVGNAPS